MFIKIKARPHSGKQEVVKVNDREYLVYLKSAPENNKANLELLKILKRYFKEEVRIKSGFTSREKIMELY